MRTHTTVVALLLAAMPIVRAEDPANPSAQTFDYFSNNWNVVGLKDYERGARVTPDNQILLAGGGSVVQVRYGGQLTPLSREHGKLAHQGWMPIMEIAANDGAIRYEFTYWATPLPTIKDWPKAFDWPTEGENFVVWVRYKAINQSDKPSIAKVDIGMNPQPPARPQLEAPQEPVVDVSLHPRISITEELPPGKSVEGAARFAFVPVSDRTALDAADYRLWFDRTVDYWRGLMGSIARIEVPDRKANEALKAAHVCQLIASDHGQMRGGEGFYDEFYLRDAANQLMALEEAGHIEMARNAIKYFLEKQRPDGRFAGGGNQGNQLDANGQTQWMLWQFYKITGDKQFLSEFYANMLRAARWAMTARRVEPKDSPYAGMLQPADSDGEGLWGARARRTVGYDFWNLRGLRCTADAARILGKPEADELANEATLYRADMDAAWKKPGVPFFPPTWDGGGRHWGNTETLWPQPIFDLDDPRVAASSHHVRTEWGGGYVEGTILLSMEPWDPKTKWALHPYMGTYTTMNDLIRGQHELVVQDFYWYLLHSTAAHAFPEGIYADTRQAWSDTIPHVAGACNFTFMLRHMLVHEQGDELHLLKAIPDWWLEEGREIRIERLPTHFGEMALAIRGTAQGVEVNLTKPTRGAPSKIVLHLPENRPLVSPVDGVTVATRSRQKVRWDFPTVIRQYRKLSQVESTPGSSGMPSPHH